MSSNLEQEVEVDQSYLRLEEEVKQSYYEKNFGYEEKQEISDHLYEFHDLSNEQYKFEDYDQQDVKLTLEAHYNGKQDFAEQEIAPTLNDVINGDFHKDDIDQDDFAFSNENNNAREIAEEILEIELPDSNEETLQTLNDFSQNQELADENEKFVPEVEKDDLFEEKLAARKEMTNQFNEEKKDFIPDNMTINKKEDGNYVLETEGNFNIKEGTEERKVFDDKFGLNDDMKNMKDAFQSEEDKNQEEKRFQSHTLIKKQGDETRVRMLPFYAKEQNLTDNSDIGETRELENDLTEKVEKIFDEKDKKANQNLKGFEENIETVKEIDNEKDLNEFMKENNLEAENQQEEGISYGELADNPYDQIEAEKDEHIDAAIKDDVEQHFMDNMEGDWRDSDYATLSKDQFRDYIEENFDYLENVQEGEMEYIEQKGDPQITTGDEENLKERFIDTAVNEFDNAKERHLVDLDWREISEEGSEVKGKLSSEFYAENSDKLDWEKVAKNHNIDSEIYLVNKDNLAPYRDEMLQNDQIDDQGFKNFLENNKELGNRQKQDDGLSL